MISSNSPTVAVVTASDHRYFGLLQGLLDSLDDAPLPAAWRRCVLDVGLSDDQRANLNARGVKLVTPGWCLDFPGRDTCDVEKRWFKAMVNRPFLPDLFPGHDAYLWIDSDAWVQDVSCLQDMVTTSLQRQAVAIVMERFGRSVNLHVAGPDGSPHIVAITEQSIRDNLARCYEACFGAETARHAEGLVTNSGVFAIGRESAAWKVWQGYLSRGLRGGARHTLVEQQALNLACLDNAIPYVSMPSKCNWNLATLQPAWNAGLAALVDPAAPGAPIGVVHLTDLKEQDTLPTQDLEGRPLAVPLHYDRFRRWRDSAQPHPLPATAQPGNAGADGGVRAESKLLGGILQGVASHRQALVAAELVHAYGPLVMSGPFSGMRLPDQCSWFSGKSPKLLGCYEGELHPWIEHAIRRQPSVVVNIGCAEGYYAVGLARRLPESRVIACDADDRARIVCHEAARINDVSNLEILGTCSPELLAKLVSDGAALVIIDIEGAEKNLVSSALVAPLCKADLIIECHEFAVPGITNHLTAMFAVTHVVEHVVEQGRDPNTFRPLSRLSSLDRWLAICEFRPSQMNWLAAWSSVRAIR